MRAETYSRLTGTCLLIGISSALLFDKFPASRLVAGSLAVLAAVTATGAYFWHHRLFGRRDSSQDDQERDEVEMLHTDELDAPDEEKLEATYSWKFDSNLAEVWKLVMGEPVHSAFHYHAFSLASSLQLHKSAISEAMKHENIEIVLSPSGEVSIRTHPLRKKDLQALIAAEAERAFGIVPPEWPEVSERPMRQPDAARAQTSGTGRNPT